MNINRIKLKLVLKWTLPKKIGWVLMKFWRSDYSRISKCEILEFDSFKNYIAIYVYIHENKFYIIYRFLFTCGIFCAERRVGLVTFFDGVECVTPSSVISLQNEAHASWLFLTPYISWTSTVSSPIFPIIVSSPPAMVSFSMSISFSLFSISLFFLKRWHNYTSDTL